MEHQGRDAPWATRARQAGLQAVDLAGGEFAGLTGARAQPKRQIGNGARHMNSPLDHKKLMKGASGDWEIVVGMEIHAQVTSRAKLFSGASTAFGAPP